MINLVQLKRVVPRLAVLLVILIALFIPFASIVYAAPADAYWVGNGGDWTDATNHWATISGGLPDVGNTPGVNTNVHFDLLSFTLDSQTVRIMGNVTCKNMDWTGATNTPTLGADAPNHQIQIHGDLTLITGMSITGNNAFYFMGGANHSITTAGRAMGETHFDDNDADVVSTLDNSNYGYTVLSGGHWNTNGNTITASSFLISGVNNKYLNLGASVVNVSSTWNYNGSNLITFTAGTSSIRMTGATFSGGSLSYNEVQFNNTATTTVSGSNTFANLVTPPATTQTIKFTDTTTQIVTAAALSGSAGHIHTLQGTGAAGWSISAAAGVVNADYISISRSTAGGGTTFNANGASVNGGNNVGWNFPLTTTTQAATLVTMDKDGVTGGAFNGTLVDMGGANDTVWFEYGLTAPAYGTDTAHVAKTAPATFTVAIPAGLTPGETYHYRSVMNNGVTTANGADQTVVLTLPTITTGSSSSAGPTVTLNGSVTDMGKASSTYVCFEYGSTSALGSYTAWQTLAGIGSFTAGVPIPSSDTTLYYRSVARIGAVSTYGASSSLPIPAATGGYLLKNLLLVLVAAGIIIGVAKTAIGTGSALIPAVLGVIAFAILAAIINAVL
jgi:hypothetical protein